VVGSPNEPGGRPVEADGTTELPPWQNAARRAEPAPAPSAPAPAGPAHAAPARTEGNVRASRYVTGVAAPDLSALGGIPQRPDPEPVRTEPRTDSRLERTEVTPVEAYASELPDLSAAGPKTARQPEPAPYRPPVPAPRLQAGAGHARNAVRATMQIRHIDPWSALKVSAMLNVALFFVWMIAVAFLYLVLGAMGVWSKLNSNVGDLLTSGSGGGSDLVSAGSIFGGAALIGLVNIVLLTAMATVGAYIYNLSTDIVGGVEVTLADLD
jgi:hypothetical protein